MSDVSRIVQGFAQNELVIRSEGPPHYVGANRHRVVVEGNPSALRVLAEALVAMARSVESDPAIRRTGRHLVLDPAAVPGLRLDPDHLLVLNCEPDEDAVG